MGQHSETVLRDYFMEEIEDVVCDCEIQKEIVKVEGKTRLIK